MGRPSSRTLRAVLAAAVSHVFLYLALLGSAFARSDAGQSVPRMLNLLTSILGFPMMWLMARFPEQWILAARTLLGDDSNTLFAFAGVNALLWGSSVVVLWKRVTSAKSIVPGTTA